MPKTFSRNIKYEILKDKLNLIQKEKRINK